MPVLSQQRERFSDCKLTHPCQCRAAGCHFHCGQQDAEKHRELAASTELVNTSSPGPLDEPHCAPMRIETNNLRGPAPSAASAEAIR